MRCNSSAPGSRLGADPSSLPPCLSGQGEREIILAVYVQPRASRARVAGLHDGSLKLALTAPPVEGQANRQVISFLAKLFRVPKTAIVIISGEQGRTKRVRISGITPDEAAAILVPLLGGPDLGRPGQG
jgi:uncharacterized protein (TIGR00251 family)